MTDSERAPQNRNRWLLSVILLIIILLVGAFMLAEPEGNGSTEEREAFTADVQAQIDVWRKDLNELRVQIDPEIETDIDLTEQVNALEARIDELDELLAEAQQGGQDAWQEIRPQIESLLADIASAFQNLSDQLPALEDAAG